MENLRQTQIRKIFTFNPDIERTISFWISGIRWKGEYLQYFTRNGKLASISFYKNKIKINKEITFYDNGNVKGKRTYRTDGLVTGWSYTYDKNGNLVSKIFHENGEIVRHEGSKY